MRVLIKMGAAEALSRLCFPALLFAIGMVIASVLVMLRFAVILLMNLCVCCGLILGAAGRVALVPVQGKLAELLVLPRVRGLRRLPEIITVSMSRARPPTPCM